MLKLIELENEFKTTVTLTPFGAAIYDIKTLDKNNNLESIVIIPNNEEVFKYDIGFYGKTIGRTAGRISDSKFILNDVEYYIPSNYPNGLHGGKDCLGLKEFEYEIEEKDSYTRVIFSYLSRDMESGYPGDADIKVIYTLYKYENKLDLEYQAISNKDTLMNLSNHTYFNLSGNNKTNILDHKLYINASKMEKTDNLIPSKIIDVKEKYSFKNEHKIGDYIFDNEIKSSANGYDLPYIFDDQGIEFDNVKLTDEASGRTLTISTTYPVVVIYTCNYPGDFIPNNSKRKLEIHDAICFECQYLPNGINSDFIENKKDILRKNTLYSNKVTYKFN